VSDADLLLNLHSPFSASPRQFGGRNEFSPQYPVQAADGAFGDMVIDTQDVDMSLLGADMMPWDLEYLPVEGMWFGDTSGGAGAGG
jgi:hypothetical protein